MRDLLMQDGLECLGAPILDFKARTERQAVSITMRIDSIENVVDRWVDSFADPSRIMQSKQSAHISLVLRV